MGVLTTTSTSSSDDKPTNTSSNSYRALLQPEPSTLPVLITRTTMFRQDKLGRGNRIDKITLPRDAPPREPEDERYLVFTTSGLNIRDPFGISMGLEDNTRVRTPLRSCHGQQDSIVRDAFWQ